MLRTLGCLLVAMLAIGCAQKKWYHQDPNYGEYGLQAAFEKDKVECVAWAKNNAGEPNGPVGSLEYGVWLNLYNSQFNSCMVGRGWYQK